MLRTVNYEALLTTVDFTFSKISATLIIEVIYSFLLSVLPGARDSISGYEELIQPDKEMECAYAVRLSISSSHNAALASLGMRQSPRGLTLTEPTLGPSGRQLRLNCWAKNRR